MLIATNLSGFGTRRRDTGAVVDPYFADVASLLHFEGADAATVTTDVKGLSWSFSGNAQIDTAQSKFGGASLLLDGSGDYLQATDDGRLSPGSSDFTLEAWVRWNSLTGIQPIFGSGSTGAGRLTVRKEADNSFRIEHEATALVVASSVQSLATAQWYHVAVSRVAGTLYLFLDGVVIASAANTIVWSWILFRIGYNAQSQYFNGWIDEVRVTNGVARYTGAFTPPGSAFLDAGPALPSNDPYWSSVSSLLHFDGVDAATSTTDEKGGSWSFVGNAQIDTAQSKFGGSSLLLDGSGDYLQFTDDGRFDFGTGDYTVEAWVRWNSLTNYQAIFGSGSTGGDKFVLRKENTQAFRIEGNGTTNIVTSSVQSLVAGQWYHVVGCRSGGIARIFLDGTIIGFSADSTNWQSTVTWVGSTASNWAVNGWIDEVRVTKGVARYRVPFTPATTAFPNS